MIERTNMEEYGKCPECSERWPVYGKGKLMTEHTRKDGIYGRRPCRGVGKPSQ